MLLVKTVIQADFPLLVRSHFPFNHLLFSWATKTFNVIFKGQDTLPFAAVLRSFFPPPLPSIVTVFTLSWSEKEHKTQTPSEQKSSLPLESLVVTLTLILGTFFPRKCELKLSRRYRTLNKAIRSSFFRKPSLKRWLWTKRRRESILLELSNYRPKQ